MDGRKIKTRIRIGVNCPKQSVIVSGLFKSLPRPKYDWKNGRIFTSRIIDECLLTHRDPGLENRELFKSPRNVHLPSAKSETPIVKPGNEFFFPSVGRPTCVCAGRFNFPNRDAAEKLPTLQLHALQFRPRLSDRSCVKDRSGTAERRRGAGGGNRPTAAAIRTTAKCPRRRRRGLHSRTCSGYMAHGRGRRTDGRTDGRTDAIGNAHAHAPRATDSRAVAPRGGGGQRWSRPLPLSDQALEQEKKSSEMQCCTETGFFVLAEYKYSAPQKY